MPPSTVTLTPTVPTPLHSLYQQVQRERQGAAGGAETPGTPALEPPSSAHPPLPTISSLLSAAMRATLLSAGIPSDHPALAPPAPSRTSRATQARSRQRLGRASGGA